MKAPPLPTAGSSRIVLLTSGLACIVVLVLLLVVTADTSPTTPTTRRLFGVWRARYIFSALTLALVGIGLILAAGSRSRVLRYLSAILAAMITLVLLEGVGLIGLISWNELFTPRVDQLGRLGTARVPNLDVKGVTYQDTAQVWGIDSDPIPFHYRTDRNGFRNHEDRPTADIILLGDSMLVAALVPFENSVTAVLEKLIGRSVMQAALIGLSPQEAHEMFWAASLDLRGRHVLQFIFEGNDLPDSRRYRAMKATGQVAAEPNSLLLQVIWNMLVEATDPTRSEMRTCVIGGQVYTFLWGRNSFEGLDNEFTEIAASLESFDTRVQAAGGRYSVVFVPKKLRVLADLCTFPEDGEFRDAASDVGAFRDDMSAWSNRSGIPVFDLTEPLVRAAKDGRIPWFWGDTHWNDVGHAVAAHALAEWSVLR